MVQSLMYTGLTPEQDAQVRAWPNETGRTNVFVSAHYAAADFQFPLVTGLSLLGFGLLFCPIVWMLLRREAQSLRPVIASANATGIPDSFGSTALRAMAWKAMIPSVIVAIIAPAVYLAVLVWTYKGKAFDPLNAPLWVPAIFLAVLLAGSVVGSALASRNLHHSETSALI
jgi:hypothetical protein